MRFIPLSRDNRPLIAYKDNPALKDGLEPGDWIDDAVAEGYGVGTFLSNSGLVVIDTDSTLKLGRKTEVVYGWKNFQDLCTDVGLEGIPETFTVRTKTPGHYHFYFRQHPDYPIRYTSIHSQIPNVDVKVTGYVVSWHTKGYEVARQQEIRQLPEEIGKRLYRDGGVSVPGVYPVGTGPGERTITADYADYLLTEVARTVNGSRNASLYKAAKVFQSAGLTTPANRSRLMQAAVNAGLRDNEAERTIASAWEG